MNRADAETERRVDVILALSEKEQVAMLASLSVQVTRAQFERGLRVAREAVSEVTP